MISNYLNSFKYLLTITFFVIAMMGIEIVCATSPKQVKKQNSEDKIFYQLTKDQFNSFSGMQNKKHLESS